MNDYIVVDGCSFRLWERVAKIVTITPDVAELLLERNTNNRKIRSVHIANLVRDMEQGNWVVDGSAIRFDTTGRLLDGQHRLTACVRAGRPFKTLLVTGISPEAGVIMDTGARRTAGDMLNMIGGAYGYGNSAAAIARILVGYSTGDLGFVRVTSSEVYQVLQRHPGIIDSIAAMGQCPIERSLVAALHYLMCADGHNALADMWRDTWASGIPAYRGDPAHLLRERLLRERGSKVKSTTTVRHNLALNAYRHFITETPITILKANARTKLEGWPLSRIGLPERLSE